MGVVQRTVEICRDEGVGTLINKIPPYLYQRLWPYLPSTGQVVKNGIPSSQERKILDSRLPAYLTEYAPSSPDDPTYEEQYVDCIRRYINQGDRVVAVGGGEGISAVSAANQVKPSGTVEVFEGGREEVAKTRETCDVNNVSGVVNVHHAIVSKDYSLRSSAGSAEIVPPEELPTCDVLIIDADGAEIPILEGLTLRPDTLIVEHHAVPDDDGLIVEYQPDEIGSLIQNLRYEIVEEQSDPTRAYGRFEERIFVAKRE